MSKIENGMYIEDFCGSPFFNINNWRIVDFNNKKVLVNNSIGNNTTTILEFNVTTNKIEIDYGVSSENNYDKFYIFIDDVQKASISGLHDITTLSENLTFGSHKITFKYSKDSSNKVGMDRGEIYEIRYAIPYKELYLIKDGNEIKGIKDNVLNKISDTNFTIDDFLNYGLTKDRLNSIIKDRNNFRDNKPKILFYTDNPKPVSLKLNQKGTPHGEIVIQKNSVVFDKTYIQHIKDISITATVEQNSVLKFIISKDDGSTWLTLKNEQWINIELDKVAILSDGMDLNTINALTEEQLILISDTKKFKLAWYMKRNRLNENVNIKQLKLDYKTNL